MDEYFIEYPDKPNLTEWTVMRRSERGQIALALCFEQADAELVLDAVQRLAAQDAPAQVWRPVESGSVRCACGCGGEIAHIEFRKNGGQLRIADHTNSWAAIDLPPDRRLCELVPAPAAPLRTKMPPTENGWYWFRGHRDDENAIHNYDRPVFVHFGIVQDDGDENHVGRYAGEWYGPLTPPWDAQEGGAQ